MTQEIKTVGIIGAGQMGQGIVQVAAQANYQVLLADVNLETAQGGRNNIEKRLRRMVDKGKLTIEAQAGILERITAVNGISDFGSVDLAIEAVSENENLKAKLLKKKEEHAGIKGSASMTDTAEKKDIEMDGLKRVGPTEEGRRKWTGVCLASQSLSFNH